jgi:hypothetical protein
MPFFVVTTGNGDVHVSCPSNSGCSLLGAFVEVCGGSTGDMEYGGYYVVAGSNSDYGDGNVFEIQLEIDCLYTCAVPVVL